MHTSEGDAQNGLQSALHCSRARFNRTRNTAVQGCAKCVRYDYCVDVYLGRSYAAVGTAAVGSVVSSVCMSSMPCSSRSNVARRCISEAAAAATACSS